MEIIPNDKIFLSNAPIEISHFILTYFDQHKPIQIQIIKGINSYPSSFAFLDQVSILHSHFLTNDQYNHMYDTQQCPVETLLHSFMEGNLIKHTDVSDSNVIWASEKLDNEQMPLKVGNVSKSFVELIWKVQIISN